MGASPVPERSAPAARFASYSTPQATVHGLICLIFAFPLRILSPGLRGGPYAPAHETAARDSRLPQRVHPAARLRAEPRGNRASVRPLLAGHGAQAPHEPAGEGF